MNTLDTVEDTLHSTISTNTLHNIGKVMDDMAEFATLEAILEDIENNRPIMMTALLFESGIHNPQVPWHILRMYVLICRRDSLTTSRANATLWALLKICST